MFWRRRSIQPIKARNPHFVVLSNVGMILFSVVLCVQRSYDGISCLVQMWSTYFAFVLIGAVYIWRCWSLYFTFNLTLERLNNVAWKDSKFIRNRYYLSTEFMLKLLPVFVINLMMPAGLLTAHDEDIDAGDNHGDDCNSDASKLSQSLIGFYGLCFVMVFMYMGFKLRTVRDGYFIKSEFKITGITAFCSLSIWYMFNNQLEDINRDVPVSTISLLGAMMIIFGASTGLPLKKSYRLNAAPPQDVPDDINSLGGLLSNELGLESFKQFLTREFNVENILFYLYVEEYRKKKGEGLDGDELKELAQLIYGQYIVEDSPFQVALSRDNLHSIETLFRQHYASGENMDEISIEAQYYENLPEGLQHQNLTPTMFDQAQAEIWRLMDNESRPRFFESEEYSVLLKSMKSKAREVRLMQKEGII